MIIVRPGQEQESAPDPPTQALPQAKYPDDAKAADFQMFPMFQLHPVSYYRGRWIHPCVNYIRSRHFPCVFKFRHPVPIQLGKFHGRFSLLDPTCLCYCFWPAYRVIVNQARAQAHRDAQAGQSLIVAPLDQAAPIRSAAWSRGQQTTCPAGLAIFQSEMLLTRPCPIYWR